MNVFLLFKLLLEVTGSFPFKYVLSMFSGIILGSPNMSCITVTFMLNNFSIL